MKSRIVIVAWVLGVSLCCGQGTVPVNPAPGSQGNVPGATLSVAGVVTPPLGIPSTSFNALGAGALSASASIMWVMAGIPVATGPSTNLLLGVDGGSAAPLALLVSSEPSTLSCAFPGPPCGLQPWLPGSQGTPFGQFHLGPAPFALVDGIGLGLNAAPSVNLGPTGNFTAQGTAPWSNTGMLGSPDNHTVQALVGDPAAPFGFSLSAAFALPKISVQCPVCAQ